MKAYTYLEKGRFAMTEKSRPVILSPRDAVVKVTLASICTSDLHIKNGAVPRAVPGIAVGHEFVGIVEETGSADVTMRPVGFFFILHPQAELLGAHAPLHAIS